MTPEVDQSSDRCLVSSACSRGQCAVRAPSLIEARGRNSVAEAGWFSEIHMKAFRSYMFGEQCSSNIYPIVSAPVKQRRHPSYGRRPTLWFTDAKND